jgi:hypothetical protein
MAVTMNLGYLFVVIKRVVKMRPVIDLMALFMLIVAMMLMPG